MKTLVITITCLFIFCLSGFTQITIPLIRATSRSVDIRINNNLHKGIWAISPEIKPDVFPVSEKNARVTFLTDADSITFRVKKDRHYDFVILLNGKDSALTRVLYAEPNLERLKKGRKYDRNDLTPIPQFTYQPASDTALSRLRTTFNLDSIAGKGTDAMRFISLVHWVHNLFPHAGLLDNPEPQTAINMISVCKKENRGLNCMGLAIILNECYLSLGYKSKFVWCMSKDSIINEAHWITVVWSPEMKRWIWMDPTFDAYVMDDRGSLLGIKEVREKLIRGEAMIVNPDANWNHTRAPTLENYLKNYMAGELYRMRCPVHSEYDAMALSDAKPLEMVELMPLDAYNQKPKIDKKTRDGKTRIYYKTNNPELFWAEPR
jgi:hypothetical protein